RATVQRRVPIYLTALVGFKGDVGSLKQIQSVAVAEVKSIAAPDCLVSMSNSTAKNAYAVQTNGSNSIDMHGCSVATPGQVACNEGTGNADRVSYSPAKNGDLCGNVNMPGASTVPTDPYNALKSSVPSKTTCGGTYPQAPSKKNDPALPSGNIWSASPTWDG